MTKLETIVSLCKRRGFIFPGSEIYGGLSGTWDYGPLGWQLKENIKQEWWKYILREPFIYPLDSAILMSKKVWEASGHLEHFSDPMIDCKNCKSRFREDSMFAGYAAAYHVERKYNIDGGVTYDYSKAPCPVCGKIGDYTESRRFNMMFKTHTGPVEDTSSETYLRPETAQGIFANFKNIIDTFHPMLPFGIAQTGKAFRNEITPQHFLFRARELEQMEMEYFGHPEKTDLYFNDIKKMRMEWYSNLWIKKENIRFYDYPKEELAHYSRATTDIQYLYDISEDGFSELEGIANRGDFDLNTHSKYSGEKLEVDGVIPHVIEPSLGLDRAFLAFLMDAYEEDEMGGEKRAVLKLHPRLAPVKVAVFPLVSNKENIVVKAREVYNFLRIQPFTIHYSLATAFDDNGNIGKRYRRQDEIGTPWCATIDYQTLDDNTITIRDRDTGKQERHNIAGLDKYFKDMLG